MGTVASDLRNAPPGEIRGGFFIGTTMTEVHQIDTDLPSLRSVVKFRNIDENCMVIAANKAKSDAKNFREAAALVQGASGDRSKVMAEWLLERAAAFEKCESDDGRAPE
jgi:hypothetical protein